VRYTLIENFLDTFFPQINGVLLFGSYIEREEKVNDVDLILLSDRFSYSSQESFIFLQMKINTIKINWSDVLGVMAKHYQQGNFYAKSFKEGVIIADRSQKIIKFLPG
jgi:hypothetical protein